VVVGDLVLVDCDEYVLLLVGVDVLDKTRLHEVAELNLALLQHLDMLLVDHRFAVTDDDERATGAPRSRLDEDLVRPVVHVDVYLFADFATPARKLEFLNETFGFVVGADEASVDVNLGFLC